MKLTLNKTDPKYIKRNALYQMFFVVIHPVFKRRCQFHKR